MELEADRDALDERSLGSAFAGAERIQAADSIAGRVEGHDAVDKAAFDAKREALEASACLHLDPWGRGGRRTGEGHNQHLERCSSHVVAHEHSSADALAEIRCRSRCCTSAAVDEASA